MYKVDLNPGQILDVKQLTEFVKDFQVKREKYKREESYFQGENIGIRSRTAPVSTGAPDNKIPVSYGRKIIQTITGYMFKPGLITYEWSENEDKAKSIYTDNREQIKNKILASYMCTNGVVYELQYLKTFGDEITERFTMVKASEGFPIFNVEIEPEIVVFCRLYKAGKSYYVEVYYDSVIITYEIKNKEKTEGIELKKVEENLNVYGVVPVTEYKNNYDRISDIEVVRELIDAYDVLMSDSMNEFERFAWAYLLIAKQSMSKENAEDIKEKRIFGNLDDTSAVKFLTKDINKEFIEFMRNSLKSEIHEQSFIPDVQEVKFGGSSSGVTIDRFIYLMEYIAADKQAYFEEGLRQRIKVMNNVLTGGEIEVEKIEWTRNKPTSEIANVDNYAKLQGRGVTDETLMRKWLPWIEDPEAEVEAFKEQEESGIDLDEPDEVIVEDEETEE